MLPSDILSITELAINLNTMSTFNRFEVPFPSSCAPNEDCLRPYPDATVRDIGIAPEPSAGYITHLPGDPAVDLLPDDVRAHLSGQLGTPLLNELYERLWLVARKSGQNIDPLHTQKVKGRSVVPTEDPRLHLVWHRDKIYIKPVPSFLLNHNFWTIYLQPPGGKSTSQSPSKSSQSGSVAFDQSIAIGFMRSYALLVPQRLDFALAKEAHLMPDDVQDWLQWSKFIGHFRHVADEHVARRYHYGQLRLSRLNWVVRIFRPRHASTMWFYEIPHWSIGDFVARATVPLLFLFAGVSLALSSMQVILSVPADDPWFSGLGESGLQKMGTAFWVFSAAVILGWLVACAFIVGIPLVVLAWQVLWGYRKEKDRKAGISNA